MASAAPREAHGATAGSQVPLPGPARFSPLSSGITPGGGPTQEEVCGPDGQGWAGDAELPCSPLLRQLTTPIAGAFRGNVSSWTTP